MGEMESCLKIIKSVPFCMLPVDITKPIKAGLTSNYQLITREITLSS